LQTQLASASTSAEVAAITTQLTAAQTALADAIAANGTASDTNATNIEALQTSLEAVQATLAELKTALDSASTSADVEALTTALATVQSDLADLLAANNVYSNSLTINSQATLDVAKSLGGKLAIINGGVTIAQTSSMSATDLQAIVDVMVTVTGSITYTMDVNGSTQAVFNNLTSVGGLSVDVSGAINFPKLQNAGAIVLKDTHKNYVTSVEFPKLSKVTSFATGSAPNTISFSKATAITLTELANYANSSLTLSGKLDFVLDLGKITSKTAAGVKNAIHLTINGAKEVILPEFTEGQIDADSTEKVVLAKYEGNAGDSFAKAEYLHLEVYELDYTSTSTSLDTLIFGGVAQAADVDSSDHPTLDLTGASGLTDLTVKGKLNDLVLSGNTSLTDVDVTGTINDVTVSGASSLETLVLGHTGSPVAADDDEASLTINNNTELSSLTVDSLVNADKLHITGNTSLETISFAKLAGVGVGEVPNVDISNNNLSATTVENDSAGATDAAIAAGGTGSIVSTSGIKTLKTYLGVAAKAATTAGSIVYAAFDSVETYVDVNDAQTGPFTYNVADAKVGTTNDLLEIVHVTPATADSTYTIKDSYAEVIDVAADDNTGITLTSNGSSVTVTKVSTETPAAFIARIGAVSLPNTTVSTGDIDKRGSVTIVTPVDSAVSSATILLGSSSYSSATATTTANAKAVVSFTNDSDATVTEIAAAIASALNGDTTFLESYNSSLYSLTGNYTTTTNKFNTSYVATNEAGVLVIAKKKTVVTDAVVSATATTTVLDRTASAVAFSLFDTSTVSGGSFDVTANSYKVLSNTYIKLEDNLFGGANTPGFGIDQNAQYNPTAMTDIHMDQIVEEEFSAWSATTGAGTTRVVNAAYSGNLVRGTEFKLNEGDGVDANTKNITTWL